jgi:cation:H+ antiporter
VSAPLAILVFAVSFAVTLAAANEFARRLDRIGLRLGLPEAMLGLLTALGADAPELATAIVALAGGHGNVGSGVVLGSNVFNLAAMLGLSALVAGAVAVRVETVALEGGVALLVTFVVAALALHWIPAVLAVALVLCVLAPYVAVLALGPDGTPRVPVGARLQTALRAAFGEGHVRDERGLAAEHPARSAVLIAPTLAVIVAGSIGMVQSALSLSDRWSVPRVVVGTLVLAVLTSLPNAWTAVRLGLARRGSALVSEALNSNTINLVGGLAVPALFVSLERRTGLLVVDLCWLVGMTAFSLALLARRQGLRRGGALLLVGSYVGFVAVQAAYG